LLFEIFELAQRNNSPVQIHSGIGDRDSDLRLANPLLFRPILESRRFSKTKFVFLHCYPFVSEAAILSSIYNNVYFDLSLSLTLNSSQAKLLFEDALAVAPYSKVLIGTDGHSVPETYWFASISARRGLKDCLEGLIEKHILTEQQCLDVASHLFFKNAQILYSLDLWSE
jgi:predicted TIM-barrel fold metal-dependent hydrolase